MAKIIGKSDLIEHRAFPFLGEYHTGYASRGDQAVTVWIFLI
jgi:hypothetical protein